ncbi:PLP-dependent aminotransferase family protein [Paracoccus fistulariae]|uniref:PLP-dependent aminotransferase family protein n=1 Tax=Paracoccus fistulariae TaxID=658446 RepID=A0ABY7SKJ1_9RHOB|nr:PLP-dependent aminotransferase family protein [Paracoccus fistulariae]MDB6181494.1 PLP-dependent aminotransferase family protein [Paracoccus fistulariae]WCR07530.1 PLP-dependent aminotransferase family protein [Paracoccus fistulariae]
MVKGELLASRIPRMRASEIRELLKLLDQPDIISFAGGIPDPALFPAQAYRDAMAAALADDISGVALQYSLSDGYGPLRDWLAGEMAKIGISCGRENILITSGSQQALDYLGKLLLSPGDTALVGWPTYLGALGAFNAYEPRYDRLQPGENRPVADVAAAAEAAGGRVKFAYLSADFANPTGRTVDRAGREQVLDLAEALDIAVIEDAAYQALRYDGEAIPPILALELARRGDIEACRTIYCGSFSKTLAPGLRMGWVCAAQEVISRLVLLKQAADLHSPTINQIATHIVARDHFDSHVPKIREVYRRRRDLMLAALAREMPEGVEWVRPEGGMFVWLTLPEGMDGAMLLVQSLGSERVAFVPGHAFYADGSGRNSIRLSFTLHDKAMMDEGIARLGRLLRNSRPA